MEDPQQQQPDEAPANSNDGNRTNMVSSHGEGVCSVAWVQIESEDGSGKQVWAALSTGSDGKLVLRRADESMGVIRSSVDHKRAPSAALAVQGDYKVAASVQGMYVETYELPDLCPLRAAARFGGLPGRAAAVGGRGGATLAAAGDDGALKLVDLADDCKVKRQIQTGGYARSVAVDPEGAYVAATLADGSVVVYDAATGAQELRRAHACKVDPESTRRSPLAWSPDGGTLLAVAGRDNDVVLLERLSWKPAVYLSGEHTAPVNALAWSPNGVYLATAGLDRRVVVWLAERGVAAAATTVEQPPSMLAWHPKGGDVLVAGEGGAVGLWAGAVPEGGGNAALPSAWRAPDEVLRDADAAAAAGTSTAAGTTLDGDDDGEDSRLCGTRRLTRRAGGGGGLAANGGTIASAAASAGVLEDDDDDGGSGGGGGGGGNNAKARGGGGGAAGVLRPGAAAMALMAPPAPRLPKIQAPVQPGATPDSGGGGGDGSAARFLAYTAAGCVVSRAADGHRTCEVLFHDASARGGRAKLPLLADYYGFTAASLGDDGVAYGAPPSADAPAMLVYRPFAAAFAAGAEWSAALPSGEAPVCVAAGRSFVAAATAPKQHLRLYSPAGRQLAVLSLPGPAVGLAASGDLLLCVTAAAAPCWEAPNPGGQRLSFAVYDVPRAARVVEGPLPLSRGASLSWLGFSREGLPAAYDSAGVLRVRTPEWGGAWVPVFDAAAAAAAAARAATAAGGALAAVAAAAAAEEAYWPVAVSAAELTCVVTKRGAPHPPVQPRPVLAVRPLQVCPAPAELAPADLEAESLAIGLRIAALRTASADAEDPSEAARLADEADAALLDADRSALKQFLAALKARREARALELVGAMHSSKSVEGAMRLASAQRSTVLAERVAAYLEERLAWEAAAAAQEEEAAAAAAAAAVGVAGGGYGAGGGEDDGGCVVDDDDGDDAGGDQSQPRASQGGGAAAAPPAGKPAVAPAAIFVCGGGGGGAAVGAKRKPELAAPAARPAAAVGGGGGGANPFARAKKSKA